MEDQLAILTAGYPCEGNLKVAIILWEIGPGMLSDSLTCSDWEHCTKAAVKSLEITASERPVIFPVAR
jgi:hypothetical protein